MGLLVIYLVFFDHPWLEFAGERSPRPPWIQGFEMAVMKAWGREQEVDALEEEAEAQEEAPLEASQARPR